MVIEQMNERPSLAEYCALKQTRLELNTRLVKELSGQTIRKGGRKLGLLDHGVLYFETEDESNVLMEFCIHDCREVGRNAVDRLLGRPGVGGAERKLLESMRRAWFSLFRICRAVPGVGVETTDLLQEQDVFIVDLNFSRTAIPGLVLATRIVPVGDDYMTTGAALPVEPDLLADILDELGAWGGQRALMHAASLSPRERTELTAIVLRTCLARGASHQIRYEA